MAPFEPSATPITVPLAHTGQLATPSKFAGVTVLLPPVGNVAVQAKPFQVPEVK
jgi:hypothetical protein